MKLKDLSKVWIYLDSELKKITLFTPLVSDYIEKKKYVLLNVETMKTEEKFVVIGKNETMKHFKIKDYFEDFLEKKFPSISAVAFCLGGGYIQIKEKNLILEGMSTDYGPVDHEEIEKIIQKHFLEQKKKS